MRILLIGNFAPPYEEENLYNLSLLRRLEEDGHECGVINISENSTKEERFIDTKGYFNFVFKLLRHCWKKDVVHFSTKGYLRLGLLKLMTSILIGRLYGAKAFITIHSELFSIAGQMRSPLGGRQTLFTSFSFANKVICGDRDTYEVASIYMKKPNFELVPSFIYVPDDILQNKTLKGFEDKERVVIFTGVKYPSFLFEILKELLLNHPLPSNIGIVITLAEKPSTRLRHIIEDLGERLKDQLIFIEPDDIQTTLMAYSKADILLRPLSCEGKTFFEGFAITVKKTLHSKNYTYFPNGLLFVKEGETAELCACILNTLICVEASPIPELNREDSYIRIRKLYELG
jgi:hypothetical protein